MLQHRGEAVEVHGLAVALRASASSLSASSSAEIETLLEQQQQGALFGIAEKAVDFGDVDQQGGGGDAQFIVPEVPFAGLGSRSCLQ